MFKFQSTLKACAAVGVLTAFTLSFSFPAAAQQPAAPAAKTKQVKDQQEFEIYNQAIKDADTMLHATAEPAGSDAAKKELQDLDQWAQRYPDSDFKDDRAYMYMQAYSKVQPPQPAKVIEYGQQLIAKDLKTVFPTPAEGRNILAVLFQVAWNTAALPNATPEQIANGEKAAHQLLDFTPTYFVAANKPAGTSDADWAKARADIEKQAKTALAALTVAPANQALAKNDCATADQLYTKALGEYPDNTLISYSLGRALSCEARANPDKATDYATRAIYEFVRAAVVDPTLGGTAQAPQITAYANTVYTQYHGSEEGLDQLKAQAKTSPLPPAGFSITSAGVEAAKKEKEFTEKEPQLALWMGIKRQLSDTTGQQYFEGQLKDANVAGEGGKRALKGTIVEGKPACRSKELLIAVPLPGQPAGKPEITLKLDAPLTGKPVPGETIEFDGVPRAFTNQPSLMLTMETEKGKISNLKIEPCAGPAARPAGKKSVGGKKK
jgi:hypothetical protein